MYMENGVSAIVFKYIYAFPGIFEFLINNIFVMFGGCVFQQTVGIPMATNCAPLLAKLFLYSYEADFIQGVLKKNEKEVCPIL